MAKNAEAWNISRRRFLAVSGSVAATSSLALGKHSTLFASPLPPPPVADYPVTIDVSDRNHIKYSTPKKGDAYILDNVITGDTISWTVKSLNKFHLAILFPDDTPFADANGSVQGLLGSQADASQGKIGGKINADGDYEYWVIVHNDDTGETYTNDPRIIVGKLNEAEKEIQSALDDLKAADQKLSDKPKLKEQIRTAEQKLKEIIHELKSQ